MKNQFTKLCKWEDVTCTGVIKSLIPYFCLNINIIWKTQLLRRKENNDESLYFNNVVSKFTTKNL